MWSIADLDTSENRNISANRILISQPMQAVVLSLHWASQAVMCVSLSSADVHWLSGMSDSVPSWGVVQAAAQALEVAVSRADLPAVKAVVKTRANCHLIFLRLWHKMDSVTIALLIMFMTFTLRHVACRISRFAAL